MFWFGDFAQLAPVLDHGGALYKTLKQKAGNVVRYGKRTYEAVKNYFMLVEPVRQDQAGPLIGPLQRARRGEVSDADVGFWKKRHRLFLPEVEKKNFALKNNRCLEV